MNADLTFNTIVFAKSFDEKGAGYRQSIARGQNTPDMLTVRNQEYVDSATKVAGHRYTIRFDRVDLDGNGVLIDGAAYAVFAVPSTMTQAQLDVLVATFKAGVADADLIAKVLNKEL